MWASPRRKMGGCASSSSAESAWDHRKRPGYNEDLDSTVTEKWTGPLLVTGVLGKPDVPSTVVLPPTPGSNYSDDLRASLNIDVPKAQQEDSLPPPVVAK